MTKRKTIPDIGEAIADIGKSPELAFITATNAPKPKAIKKAKAGAGSIEDALTEAAATRAKKEVIRGAFVLEKDLYLQAKAFAKRHNLSFNALAITLLKLAIEKEGK